MLLLLAACGDDAPPFKNQRDTDLALMHDHDPETERRSFTLLPGFEVNLFAAEPMLANPVAMTWDERGRLWVACSWSYPQLRPGETPDDQIVILEDTDGDGRADRHTVFADGLYIPTGFELAANGVYVAQAPDLLRLVDEDGDDRADTREIVLSGFGIEDSHHSISAFRRGPGGWIHFHEGLFLHSQVETAYGNVHLDDGGVYRFRPGRDELTVFADLRVGNPWGHLFDRFGESILVDNGRLFFLAPATASSRAKLDFAPMIKTDKQCGGEIVQSPHFPDSMQGQVLTCWYKNHTLIRYSLAEHGAGMSATLEEPLLRARHPNFRPVDCRFGPDGALYVADWYNPIINHSQHDFRDPRRDTAHGRIWRITYKDRPLNERLRIEEASLLTLLDGLKSADAWQRDKVRLALTRRDRDEVVTAVESWLEELDPTDPEHEVHRLEALWVFQTLDVPNQELVRALLTAARPEVRTAALRVLRDWLAQIDGALELLDVAVRDDHPRVRLEAVLTLSFIQDARALPVLLQALDRPRDRFLDHALTLAMDGLEPHWVPALEEGTLEFRSPEHRAHAMAASPVDVARSLGELLDAGDTVDVAQVRTLVARLATAGKQADADFVLEQALGRAGHPALVQVLLHGLEAAARQRGLRPANHRLASALRFLRPDQPPAVRVAMVRLLGAWKFGEAGRTLTALARDPDTEAALRRATFETIGEIGGDDSRRFLQGFAKDGVDWRTQALGVLGLAADDVRQAAPYAAGLLATDPGDQDPVTLLDAFTTRVGGADAIAGALRSRAPHERVRERLALHLVHTGLPHEALRQVLRASGTSLSEVLAEEDTAALAAAALEQGDATRGERLFRSPSLACLQCHSIGGAGASLGPDLTSIGTAATPERIVDSILRPSLAMAEEYECIAVTTHDGRVFGGTLASQSEREVLLRDAGQAGAPLPIARTRIKELSETGSLMPEGLADGLASRQEFLDLVYFLTELGRPGAYARDVAPVVRTWRRLALDGAPEGAPSTWAPEHRWLAAYSMVNGALPATDLGGQDHVALRAAFDVQTPGPIQVVMSGPAAEGAWLDAGAADLSGPLPVTAGRHHLTLLFQRSRIRDGVRVEIQPATGSATRLAIVGGR